MTDPLQPAIDECREIGEAVALPVDPVVKAVANAVLLNIAWKGTRAEAERVVRAAMEEAR